MTTLRLGTRRSALAVTQSTWVADQLRAQGHQVELVHIVTEGDINAAPLTQIGGTGVFASALRAALVSGEVDFAVHSLKDLPVAPEPKLTIAALPQREHPEDVLIARDDHTVDTLPSGAVIGTGSPRRAAQLTQLREDCTMRPIRGNVDSRLRQVDEGTVDAVLLARAGVTRLGLTSRITEVIPPSAMVPAAGQGALAVECRADRVDVISVLKSLDHPITRACVTAERAVLATLEAGCTAPLGVLAVPAEHSEGSDPQLNLTVFWGADDVSGRLPARLSVSGPLHDPLTLGHMAAQDLLATVPPSPRVAASSAAAGRASTDEEQPWRLP